MMDATAATPTDQVACCGNAPCGVVIERAARRRVVVARSREAVPCPNYWARPFALVLACAAAGAQEKSQQNFRRRGRSKAISMLPRHPVVELTERLVVGVLGQ
jgi:hypothetical protein